MSVSEPPFADIACDLRSQSSTVASTTPSRSRIFSRSNGSGLFRCDRRQQSLHIRKIDESTRRSHRTPKGNKSLITRQRQGVMDASLDPMGPYLLEIHLQPVFLIRQLPLLSTQLPYHGLVFTVVVKRLFPSPRLRVLPGHGQPFPVIPLCIASSVSRRSPSLRLTTVEILGSSARSAYSLGTRDSSSRSPPVLLLSAKIFRWYYWLVIP